MKDEWDIPPGLKTLRQYWADLKNAEGDHIGFEIPEGAEVWSRPEKKNEVFGYEQIESLQRELQANQEIE